MRGKKAKKIGDGVARATRDVIGVPVSAELRKRIDVARSRESGKSAAQFAREAIDARLAIVEASMEVGC